MTEGRGWCVAVVHSNFSNQAAFSQLLLIFLSFLIPAAWVNGDPRRVAYPTDSQGHFCGQKDTPNEWVWPLFFCFVWFYGLSWNLWITFALILADFIRRLKFINRTSFIFFPKTVGCFILYNLRHHCHIAYIRMHKGSA